MKKLDSAPLSDDDTRRSSARRLLKISSLLQAELGKIISRELELPRNVLLTISRVEVPADYSQARVGLSVMPFPRAAQVMKLVNETRAEWQRLINQRLRIYRVPKLVFYLDDTAEQVDSLNRLLDKLDVKQ